MSWCRGLQTDSDGIPYHAYLGMRAADIHIKTHMHTALIHRSIKSIGQSARPSFTQSVGRGGSSRIVSGGSPVSTTQRAAASSLHPVGLAHLSLPHCCVAALLRCCCSCAVAVAFAWALGDGPELDEHAPWTIPGRDQGGLFTDPVFNELVVRGGDDR